MKAIGKTTELDIPKEVLVVDKSKINDYIAAVKCTFYAGCEDKIYVSKHYLQSGRKRDDFLNTAYHEVLHFNDSRWNTNWTGVLQFGGFTSARHDEITRLGLELGTFGGLKGTTEEKIYRTFVEYYK